MGGQGQCQIFEMQRASASSEGNGTGPTGTGFSLEVPCSQVTQGISTEFRDNVLFPGRAPGEQRWVDEPLVLKCCQVGSTEWVPPTPQTAPEAKQNQLPLSQHGEFGPCPLSLVPKGPCSLGVQGDICFLLY